jgi:DNA-binding LacI/PurR family transcriptional regulator
MIYIEHMNKEIKKIYRSLLQDIASGRLKSQDVLPKETDLANQFKTNRMNAQRAVNALAAHNIVTRKKRIGTTVNPHLDHEKLDALLKETNRSIYVLYSMTPHWIHWNEASFAGLEEIVEPKGFSVTYCNIPTGSGRVEYKKLLNDMSEAGASALVIFPDSEDSKFLSDNADLLLDFQMPIFMLNRGGEPIALDMVSFVSSDPFGDGVYVGTLLKKNNHKNILIISYSLEASFWNIKRCEGLEMGLQRDKQPPGPRIRRTVNTEQGLRKAAELIGKANGDITVVAINNEYAANLIDLCNSKGLRIPDDYQLIAFDDNPLYRSYNLTSMGMPRRKVGKVLGQMICDDSWLKEHKGKISIKLNSELIIRETLKPQIT